MKGYSGIRFDADSAKQWSTRLGMLADPETPWDSYSFKVGPKGPRLSRHASMAIGIYVVVDVDELVVYIGKVCRDSPAGLLLRHARHHATAPYWHRMWVIRMADDAGDEAVRRVESMMIAAYSPVGNTAGVAAHKRRT